MRWMSVPTPIGPVAVAVADGTVCRAAFHSEIEDRYPERSALLRDAGIQLREYFTGERVEFDLPLAVPAGVGTRFERAVWAELARIPYGEQRTYGQVASAVGDPGAARAVGTACNRNPLPLFVPCHRVVGAGGRLVGFGGGLTAKRWLLEHEARTALVRAWGQPR